MWMSTLTDHAYAYLYFKYPFVFTSL
jgi:hypothetical protein